MIQAERELTPEEIERSTRVSPREVSFSAIMLGLTDPFMIPYALALGATAFQAGLLTSVRNLIISVVQLRSADAVHWFRSRKRVVLTCVAIQIASYVPLILLGLHPGQAAVAALILFYTLGTTASSFSGPAWASLVSSYLGADHRGAYFGRLSRLVGFWTTLATLAGGGILQLFAGRPFLGFALLLGGAAFARLFSYRLLAQLAEGPHDPAPESRFTFWEFIKQARTSNFVHFTLAIAFTSFGVNLATSFFAVWVLKELQYSYFIYALTQLAATLTTALVVPAWGKAGDRIGNQAVLRWTGLSVCVMPFLWPFLSSPAGLIALGLFGGVAWAGYNLSVVNFVFDAAVPAKRARCLAYFNVVNGFGVSFGALAGGWILTRLPAIHGSAFASLFLLSGIMRLAGALLFRAWVREVKPVPRVALPDVVMSVARMPVGQVLAILTARRGSDRRFF